MSIRSSLVATASKILQKSMKLLGRTGESYPGVFAQKLDKNILSHLAKDYDVVLITGTNGKTLTTSLTAQLLRERYPNLLTNSTGSNMNQGIISAFLSHKPKKNERKIAVLEVDEAHIPMIVSFMKPLAIVTTNLFRDQMDRFGEIYSVYNKILEGVKLSPKTTIIANGDAAIFNSASFPNPKLFFGFANQEEGDIKAHYNTDNTLCPKCNKVLHYRYISYANLGKYFCANCDFKRPQLDFSLTSIQELSLSSSTFTIDENSYTINIAGLYNIYNALAAYSVAKFFSLTTEEIARGFSKAQRVFGRQEMLQIKDKSVLINLIKNPVGLNQVLDLITINNDNCSVIALLNDNIADGQDVSWIWDGQFEKLNDLDIKDLKVGGIRRDEMKFRLCVAGFEEENIKVIESFDNIIEEIESCESPNVHILATYTAMLNLRKILSQNNYVKGELS